MRPPGVRKAADEQATPRVDGLSMQHDVALAVAEARDVHDAYTRALAAITLALGWRFAAVWERNGEALVCAAHWAAPDGSLDGFASATGTLTLGLDEGLPGRVWSTSQPVWVSDAAAEAELPRASAARAAGLHVAVAFPLHSERGVVGVVEVFGERALVPDEELLATLRVLGVHLGQLVERRRAEDVRHTVEQRHRATLQAALDCVVTMDHDGRVLAFNPAAERTFGYSSDAAVGREMAELIVPPDLREAHRRGLARYLTDGTPRVLDRRFEIEAMHAGGARFPVELAITRIDVPGPPTFTGHMRDISERREAEVELKESRARIVQAGDEARRRIERDLHDGAQQQLVSVAMNLGVALELIERDPAGAREILQEASGDLREALAELRELARGIHPAVLTEGGLDPAVRGLVRRSSAPVKVVAIPGERLPAPVEAAAYFVVAEGLTNAARHASARQVEVELVHADDRLRVEVRDDGAGFDPGRAAGGLRGLADRVAALDGVLRVSSAPGEGTILRAEIPCES